MNEIEWKVSQTGGQKISADKAASILKVTRGNLYNYTKKNLLLRAEKRRRGLSKQPLVFFLRDVVALALEYERITPEEAAKILADEEEKATVAA